MPSLKCIVFAAGLGTRLRPLTDEKPKPLIEIGGKPILLHTLEALPDAVSEVIVVIGYKGEMIREAVARFSGTLAIHCVDQPELRGTYDAFLRAKPLLDDQPFLVLNGDDVYAKEDLENLAATKPFAMLTHRVPSPNPYSHLESENGFLKRILPNKEASGLAAHEVYVGAAVLDARFFSLAPAVLPNGEYGLPQTLAQHCDTHPVRLIESRFWMPVGTPQELEVARKALED